MSTKIDREGTFKCLIPEHSVNTSTNGHPQFVGQFLAIEMWDEDSEIWQPWDYEQELVGYFVLFSKDGTATLNASQVMEALGWDGKSLCELDETDYSEKVVQIRVELNEYKGKTSLQVSWLDAEDAIPGVKVKKMDRDALKSLDSQFNSALKLLGGRTPAKAPTQASATPPKATPPTTAPSVETAAHTAAIASKTESKKRRGRPPKNTTPPTPAEGSCTQIEAWESSVTWVGESFPEEKLSEVWLQTVIEIVGEKTPDDKITDAQWYTIKEAVAKKASEVTGVPF